MHYYGDRYKPLYLPGSSYVTESIHQCPPQADGCSNTCHPLSITKSPVARWQSYTQALPYVSQSPLLSCQPYIQKCVVLYPEPCETTRLLPCETTRLLPCETTRLLPCETTRLLPCRKPSLRLVPATQNFQPCETTRPEKKRVAKSLPPCAPRCPEPGKLRFPPCGIRYSASCKDEGRCHKMSKCSSRWYGSDLRLQGLTSGYSLPLRGVTECPPQPCVTQPYLQEHAGGFPQHKCTKGYPTQECVTSYSSKQRLAKCPPPEPPKCPPGKGVIKESSTQRTAAKCSVAQEGAKTRSSSTQHPNKTRCLSPRAAHHAGHQPTAGLKRSSHAKKSRCAAKWIW